MTTSYRKSAVDTIFIGIATFLQFLVGLFVMPLISKTMGAQGYGIWAQVNSTVGLILPLSGLGLGAALVRFLAAEKRSEEVREGFYSVIVVLFGINLVVALLIIFFAEPLASRFFGGATRVVQLTGVLVLLVSMVENYLLLIRIFQLVKSLSFFMAAETLIFTGAAAYLVLHGHGIVSVTVAWVTIKVLEFLLLFFYTRARIGIKWPRFSRIKEFLGFGLPNVPGGIAFWLINLGDRYIIGFFLGASAVGIYSAGYSLGSLPYGVIGVLNFVLVATLPQLYDEGKLDEVKTHLSYTLKYFLAVAIPFIFATFIIGEPVLRVFSTPEIASKGHIIAPLTALAVTFLCIRSILWNVLMLVKKIKAQALILIIAAVVSIVLNLVLVPMIGIIAAALSFLIVFVFITIITAYYSFKEFTFYIDWRFIIKSVISSMVMSAALWLMHPVGVKQTFYVVLIGIAIYWVVLIVLRGFSRNEFKFFLGLLKGVNDRSAT